MSGAVVVYAFEPVDELDGRCGVLVVAGDLAERLIAEDRAELMGPHSAESMRYVTGSAANIAAAAAHREARDTRGLVSVRSVQVKPKSARTSRLES